MFTTSEIPESEFSEIVKELERFPLPVNNYRNKSGVGRSQTFGIVNRRCMPPDYSRLCWTRPYLYKLLLDFGAQNVKVPYTSITLTQDYREAPHRDKGNVGMSFLVAFGNFEGGELEVLEGDCSGVYDINRKPITTELSKVLHCVKEYAGSRYSLVYYTAKKSGHLPAASVIEQNGKYLFKRGDEIITTGLVDPLKSKKRVMTFTREEKEVCVVFE